MICTANGADVAGELVEMGMGRSAGPFYAAEQADARLHRRGIWRGQGIKVASPRGAGCQLK
jgi:endonuclease YncB( thermonuclease family)